jgi:LacI family transcriptional regulator
MHTYSRMGATSCDIARRAGVSQATVSRVLTGNPAVRQELRDKVNKAVRELNYRPNGMARAMRTSRSGNIGVVVSRLAVNPLYPALLHVLGSCLSEAKFRLVVWNTDEMGDKAAADAVGDGMVDGIVMTTATAVSAELYQTLRLNAPIVLINRIVEGWPCDQVASDNLAGGRMVGQYLLSSDRRRIGLVTGLVLASTIRERECGFRETLTASNQPLDERLVERVDHFSYNTGFMAAARLLDLANPPDTLFCINDLLALGARDAARDRGFEVPGKLWIVGYDDIEMASWHTFDLTTIRQPLSQMVDAGVRFLLERINGYEGEHRNVRLPNDLVIRGSTFRGK